MRACSALMILLVVLSLAACNKPEPAAKRTTSSNPVPVPDAPAAPKSPAVASTTLDIKKVDASGFKLSYDLPPLDGGKIEIATPDGWKPMSRDSKFVVRFSELKGGGGLPRIEVFVEENDLGGLTDVTQANVAAFTTAVAKDLEAHGTAVIETPVPMVIGSVPCVRYVSHLKLKIGEGTLLVERQTLLHAGRVYKIDLLVELDKLNESHRDAAYAVCAGVRFPAVESPATE